MGWDDNRGGGGGGYTASALLEMETVQAALSCPVTNVQGMQRSFATFRALGVTVLSPAITAIQPGYAIALSLVEIEDSDTYDVGGHRVALGKNALNKIASAAGVEWDPVRSGRMDDGSDPLYCRYKAVGVMTGTDGQHRFFSDEKELDLRPGSPQVQSHVRSALRWRNYAPGIFDEAAVCDDAPTDWSPAGVRKWRALVARYNARYYALPKGNRPKHPMKDPFIQLDEIAGHLASHCITKAKNRALRSALNVPVAGNASEMRSFLVAKPYFSGQFADPEVTRAAHLMIAQQAVQARSALYGVTAQAIAAEPARAPLLPPPPMATVDDDDSWNGPSDGGGVAFLQMDKEHQIDAVLEAAEAKGRLGDGEGLLNSDLISTWTPATLHRCYERLLKMEPVGQRAEPKQSGVARGDDHDAPTEDSTGEPIPDFR